MEAAPQALRSEPGDLLRYWRRVRGKSQMSLALDAGVSSRHLSFVETGRARPSRELLLRLAAALEIPSREENALLESAGHARHATETQLNHPDLAHVKSVLRFLLDRHEPYSALVFDHHWNIVMENDAQRRSAAFFLSGPGVSPDVRENLLRMTFHPSALQPHIMNWNVVAPALVRRVEREVEESPTDRVLAGLLEEIRSYAPLPRAAPPDTTRSPLLLPIHLRKDGCDLKMFSVLSTIGAAIDVSLQALRLETFFPADAETERQLEQLAAAAD